MHTKIEKSDCLRVLQLSIMIFICQLTWAELNTWEALTGLLDGWLTDWQSSSRRLSVNEDVGDAFRAKKWRKS